MAAVPITIPEEILEIFEEAFKGQDLSAIVANLMREAAERAQQRKQQNDAIDKILELRAQTPPVSPEAIRAAREELRG
jgi:hypothetical protein